MKAINIVASLATIYSTFLLASEPSAFNAGNLDTPNPYGLTSAEKIVLENKKRLHTVLVKSNNQSYEVDSIRERIDGLQSIVESLSRKAQDNKRELKKLSTENSEKLLSSNEYEKRISIAVENNTKLLNKISVLVDSINKDYVTKLEFNSLVKDVNKFKELVAIELSKNNTPKEKKKKPAKYEKTSNSDIAISAQVNFDKKYYTKAIEQYNYLINNSYKPAKAHYMIGEMNFRRKKYTDAIAYFKKSASLYSKASYMPTLMLHTAISMDKTGDTENAKTFFNAVISNYSNTQEATEAEEKLNSL